MSYYQLLQQLSNIDLSSMQNNTPKEPIPPMARERPLQKSMFLEQYTPISPYNPQPSEHMISNPLKRSLMENPNSIVGSPQYQFRAQPNTSFNNSNMYQPQTNLQSSFSILDSRPGSQRQIIQHSNSTNNIHPAINMRRTQTQVEESKPIRFDKPEHRPPLKPKHQQLSPMDNQGLISDVVNQIKEKHLSPLINLMKKELMDEITALKQEFLNFRQEMWAFKGKQQTVNNELRNQLNIGKIEEALGYGKGNKQKENEIVELQKQYFLMEGKLKELQSKMSEGFNQMLVQFQSQKQQSFRPSAIRSSLSPIMLEYRQLFAIKGGNGKSNEQPLIISTCHYYVDKNGYLMDSDSRYLIDRKGSQIRLQQRHLKLLQKHKILYK